MTRLRRPRASVLFLGALLLVGCNTSPSGGRSGAGPTARAAQGSTGRSGGPAMAPAEKLKPIGTSAGLRSGKVSAIGDSVMLDYAPDLEHDLPTVHVDAVVSRQWTAGIADVRALRARHALGSEVIIALGTNGAVTPAEFNEMRTALEGTSRVVFVNVHVDQPWEASVNSVLRAGVRTMPDARLANWYALASAHPGWFYPDGTHLPVGGPGAKALAALVVRTLRGP